MKTTCLRNFGEYFFNSKRSGLLRLFLLVKYKRSPVSAHSNKMLIRMDDTSHSIYFINSLSFILVYINKCRSLCQFTIPLIFDFYFPSSSYFLRDFRRPNPINTLLAAELKNILSTPVPVFGNSSLELGRFEDCEVVVVTSKCFLKI